MDMVYMDMSKAFDKVCHHRLLSKLCKFCLGGNLLQWIQSYLTDRRQRVTESGATSKPLSICSGVPQGSILGPALFLLYENDFPDALEESNIAVFADDTKIDKEVKSAADVVSLQSDLNRLDTWSKDSGLTFNETKTQGSENIQETEANRVIVQHQRESSRVSGHQARLRSLHR